MLGNDAKCGENVPVNYSRKKHTENVPLQFKGHRINLQIDNDISVLIFCIVAVEVKLG